MWVERELVRDYSARLPLVARARSSLLSLLVGLALLVVTLAFSTNDLVPGAGRGSHVSGGEELDIPKADRSPSCYDAPVSMYSLPVSDGLTVSSQSLVCLHRRVERDDCIARSAPVLELANFNLSTL